MSNGKKSIKKSVSFIDLEDVGKALEGLEDGSRRKSSTSKSSLIVIDEPLPPPLPPPEEYGVYIYRTVKKIQEELAKNPPPQSLPPSPILIPLPFAPLPPLPPPSPPSLPKSNTKNQIQPLDDRSY